MTCPAEELIVLYADGQLASGDRQAVQRHLAGCPNCAELVAEAADDEPATRTRPYADAQNDALTIARLDADVSVGWLPRGTIVGRYVVLEEIGVGGLGRVYAAYDPELDRRVALKLLKGSASDEASRRLLREAQAMAKLSHPNVVAVHDCGVADDRAFIAMQLVQGCTLQQWLAESARAPAAIRDVFVQAGQGLAAAHAQGLVHRDFKPANVLIDGTGRVMVTDFGLATAPGDGAASPPAPAADALERPHQDFLASPLTGQGVVMGTPGYVPPEQLTGDRGEPRGDQFSFCVSLFTALHRTRPFRAGQGAAVYFQDVRDAAHLRVKHDATVPAALDRAVARGLSFDPALRHASMTALLTELTADRRSRRRAGIVAAVVGVMTLVALALVLSLYQPPPSPAELSAVDALSEAAKLAASRAYFIVPPDDEPDFLTAYRAVVALETGPDTGAAGRDRAGALRQEFATTLFRLGDEYWDRAGGRTFAADYYAAAMMFAPGDPRVADRLLLTGGQMAALADKAVTGSFTAQERLAAEPLAALGDPDTARRATRVAALRTDPRLPSSTRASLEEVDGGPPAILATQRADGPGQRGPRPRRQAEAPPEPTGGALEATDEATDDGDATSPAAPTEGGEDASTVVDAPGSRKAASAEVALGRAAIDANDMRVAVHHFHRALQLQRSFAPALAGLSEAHFETGDYTKAAEFGERAVAKSPKTGRYRILLGDAYLRALKYSAAQVQYEQAATLGEPRAARRLDALRDRLGKRGGP